MVVDPRDHRTVWAGAEVDLPCTAASTAESTPGSALSGSGTGAVLQLTLHCMGIRNGARTAVHATSPFGFATSTDDGDMLERAQVRAAR